MEYHHFHLIILNYSSHLLLYSSNNKSNSSSSSSSSSGNSSGGTTSKTETTCSHNWVWKTHTETVHHDAVTHEEPIYSEEYQQPIHETRIRCSWCGTDYMSYDDYYANDTCHSGWSEVTVTTGYYTVPSEIIGYDTVVDKDAYDSVEEIKDYQYCSKCGARK